MQRQSLLWSLFRELIRSLSAPLGIRRVSEDQLFISTKIKEVRVRFLAYRACRLVFNPYPRFLT